MQGITPAVQEFMVRRRPDGHGAVELGKRDVAEDLRREDDVVLHDLAFAVRERALADAELFQLLRRQPGTGVSFLIREGPGAECLHGGEVLIRKKTGAVQAGGSSGGRHENRF